jgi:hypothetical protein
MKRAIAIARLMIPVLLAAGCKIGPVEFSSRNSGTLDGGPNSPVVTGKDSARSLEERGMTGRDGALQ